LIMEYLSLGDLGRQHKLNRIQRPEVRQLLLQAANALQYLHSQTPSLVHRDIKPQNILVKSRDPFHIKLTDFGISKYDADNLITNCGTPRYTAPEVLAYKPYDNKVDIWSLGVVIMEYSDKLPRNHSDFHSIIKAASKLPSDEPIFQLLKRMLKEEPSERPSAKECFQVTLGAMKERDRENDSDRRDRSGAVTLTARGEEPLASSKISTQTLPFRIGREQRQPDLPTGSSRENGSDRRDRSGVVTLAARGEEPLASSKISAQTLPFPNGGEGSCKRSQPNSPTWLSGDQKRARGPESNS
jgi:serine/threonine protein kinase